jgi:hypothetical protein
MIKTLSFRLSLFLPNRLLVGAARLAMCLLLMMAMRAGTQNVPGQQHGAGLPQVGPRLTDPMDDMPTPESLEQEKTLRALNAARQRSMVADTDRLVRLVNELNAEVERTNPDLLTPAQLHKVAEIEKLAHNVKDKMSTSVRSTPTFEQPHFQHQ